MEVELHAAQHICYDGIIPFSYDNIKTCFQNSDYIRENLLRRMELFKLPILESGNLNLKAWAFKFFIVLLLCFCYNILFYFNCSSLPISNGLKSETKIGKIVSFFFWFKHGFPWSKEEEKTWFYFHFFWYCFNSPCTIFK